MGEARKGSVLLVTIFVLLKILQFNTTCKDIAGYILSVGRFFRDLAKTAQFNTTFIIYLLLSKDRYTDTFGGLLMSSVAVTLFL